jgi:LysM repeat protein
MKELLRTRADCVCNESKVIGNKVVFKGEAKLDLLYRSPDHKLCTANFQLPFSQIMENSELSEEATPELRIIFTDVSCKPADGEGRNVAVELELLAQCVLRKQENSPVLTDLYSTKYDAVPVFKPLPISRLMDQGVAPETVREVLESGMPVENIMDVQIRPMQMNTVKQGNEMAMNAEVEAYVLYKNDQGGMGSLHRRMIIIHQIPIANHWNYQCEFWISRGGTATPVSGGVEVAFTIEYSWNAMENGAVEVVERASLEDKKPTTKESPSVIIRSVRSGESLWEIAKAYGTTVAEIVEANSLPTTEIYPGQMLMIPRVKERMMA